MGRECKEREHKSERYKEGIAEIILGDKIVFASFSGACTKEQLKKKAIVALANSLQPSFKAVLEDEIDLHEYEEFLFYIEDYAGRKILLENKDEKEYKEILRFFSYHIVLYIQLNNI